MPRKQTVKIGASKDAAKAGIFIGRMNPMHLGHQQMIEGVLNKFGNNHLILVGSCNHPISVRHLFNYRDRTEFIRAVFPNLRIAPLPDFERDNETWFHALDDLIQLSGIDPRDALYIGGSHEDVQFYFDNGRNVEIVNRYSGPTVKVSGSEVRDALIEKRVSDIRKALDKRVFKLVKDRFDTRWNEIRQR